MFAKTAAYGVTIYWVGASGASGNKRAVYIGEFALYWLMASDLLLGKENEGTAIDI